MANKTFIPAFEARVGDWNYYVALMKYAQVAREVQFAHELGGNKGLNDLIQRGIHKRTEEITEYLIQSEHRFLGALIVAAWGGEPAFLELGMEDPEGVLSGVDQGFGVLTLDGTQSFFALDGQHRLQAIKDALKKKPELGKEDICVLLVAHYDTVEGRERTQRLFTNINRNAKTTTPAENIALDVDDGYAVVLRALLNNHHFLKQDGRVRVFTKPPTGDGKFTLAGANIPKSDPTSWTTITVLYDLLGDLGFGLDGTMQNLSVRPSDDVLDQSEELLGKRIDDLLKACEDLEEKLKNQSAKELRVPKTGESKGHPLMRPVIQKSVARVIADIQGKGLLDWDETLSRLQKLEWQLGSAPWSAVFNPSNRKMITAKENTLLLDELLMAHLAPISKAQIQRARANYKQLKNSDYPISVDEMKAHMVAPA